MKEILLGGRGMLGTDLAALCRSTESDCVVLDREEIDIAEANTLEPHLVAADWVINCAAYTRVDDAEKERELCHRINALGAGVAAGVCARRQIPLIHISTDYVFDGKNGRACTESDPVHPLNWYGQTKLEGEQRVLAAGGPSVIVRTQSLYGLHGRNFVKAILNQLLQGKTSLRVVADQISSPTYTLHLAEALLQLMRVQARGIVNVACSGHCSWKEFAESIVESTRPGIPVEPLSTAELNFPALRPAFSVLDTARYTKLTGRPMPSWRDGLAAYLALEPLTASVRALPR